jgi:hypothetical protein
MKDSQYFLDAAAGTFKARILEIKPEAARWIQLKNFEETEQDTLVFYFKSSQNSLSFEVEVKRFSNLYPQIDLTYNKAYYFFRALKYEILNNANH